MKSEICAPSKHKKRWTCYSNKQLRTLKRAYNKTQKHGIRSNRPRDIWNELHNALRHCKQESCFATTLHEDEMKNRAFAPTRPITWEKKITEWLSSDDITGVLRQYERVYKDFKYIGPSPSDFYYLDDGKCVWEELCKFKIKNAIAKGHVKVGIVFNLDDHHGPGTHWVAVYLDLVRMIMYYFDSAGGPIEDEPHIYTLYTKLKHQESKLVLKQNHPIEHQYGKSECGMYVIFFIVTMIQSNKFKLFTNKNKIFKDEEMIKLRSKMFNKNTQKNMLTHNFNKKYM
jgi:hypothetical protein